MRIEEFFRFMNEREAVRLRKEAGEPWPWTADEILQTYKFTNVKREHDKTTRRMKVLYHITEALPPEQQLMNCATARYFGTWEFLDHLYCEGILTRWSPKRIQDLARERQREGKPVFTGAYVVTNQGIKRPKIEVVVECFLTPLYEQSKALTGLARSTGSWRQLIEAMSRVQGFGGTGFMAKEVVLDTMFTSFWKDGQPTDFNEWCPAGPGARRGLNRVFERELNKTMTGAEACAEMRYLFDLRSPRWAHSSELVLHDIQFQLCEFDKYERVRLGEGKPRSKYRRPA